MPMNSTIAMPSEMPICPDESCSSSSEDSRAPTWSAFMPIAIDCPSTMMPRRNGFPRIGTRFTTESISCDSRWISPDGRRTATAQWSAPRIMTPSMTAWPP